MTVSELIRKLSRFNGDASVWLCIDSDDGSMHSNCITDAYCSGFCSGFDTDVTITADGKNGLPTFDDGYDAGYRDAVEKMTDALNEIARGDE